MKRLALAVATDFAFRALAGMILALPLVSAVASTGIGRFPGGDRLLFEPGGLLASEVALQLLPAVSSTLSSSLLLFVVFALLLVVPHAGVLALLAAPRTASAREWSGRALASVPALLLLSGVALLAQVLALTLAGAFAGGVRSSLSNSRAWVADGAFVAVLLLGGLLSLGIGLARDLGRAAAVRYGEGGRAALFAGIATLRREPLAALGAFAVSVLGCCSVVVLAAVLTAELDVSKPEGYRFLLVVLLHQTAAAGIALFRVRWFRTALELSRVAPEPEPSSTPEPEHAA